MFRKIHAESNLYKETKNEFLSLYQNFNSYAELETKLAGKSLSGKSGKSSSYARYLIRLIIFYREINPNSYNTFSSLEEFKVFKDTLLTPEFKEYNMREGHFPGSTLNAFERYLAYKNSVIEDQIHKVDDLNLDQSESYTINDSMSNIVINEEPIEYKTVKKSKTLYKNLRIYPRNINESRKAKMKANWQCEFDRSHQTFISKSDHNNYMESHHLIPMSHQDFFEYTIDFADNIICLCPNCHRKIHHATDEEITDMISLFYNKRRNIYPEYGINIDLDALLTIYKINK